MIMFLQEYQ